MTTILIVFASAVACAVAVGPTTPYGTFTVRDCSEEGIKVADKENMCWYHECVNSADARGNVFMTLLPRSCALGTRVSYNFITGKTTPCLHNFNSVSGYECQRTQASFEGPPPCAATTVCQNGGTATYESGRCWCNCRATWQGDSDCSKPTRDVTGLPPNSNICVDGAPADNWCAMSNGCLNGGTCFNQCDTFWCDCPNKSLNDYKGKRCEK